MMGIIYGDIKMRQEGIELPGLECLLPRVAGGTLTPRLDCIQSLTGEERDFTKMFLCLFPRIKGLMSSEGGEEAAALRQRASPNPVISSSPVIRTQQRRSASPNSVIRTQQRRLRLSKGQQRGEAPPQAREEDFKSVLAKFGIRV